MTRSKIQRIKFFVSLLIFLLAQSAVSDGSFRENKSAPESTPIGKIVGGNVNNINAHATSPVQKNEQQSATLTVGTNVPDGNKTLDDLTLKSTIETNKTAHTPQREHLGEGHSTSLNPGAFRRGFYVFVGLSVLVMAYIVFRSFRLSKTRAQMVRKYGVLAHRQDVEMRPLPLEEEDDEDTTVFDASNVLTNNVQHQNL